MNQYVVLNTHLVFSLHTQGCLCLFNMIFADERSVHIMQIDFVFFGKQEDKPLRLRISVPSADDMADYLTSASQYFGENLIKGATVVAGGITT